MKKKNKKTSEKIATTRRILLRETRVLIDLEEEIKKLEKRIEELKRS